MMCDADIRSYAGLMKELELTALEITENGKTVRLERTLPVQTAVPAVILSEHELAEEGETLQRNSAGAGKENRGELITSPIVGVFYAAPAENADPYVRVGSHVHRGDTLCIIEAMKLMNEITAEEDGVITEICVKNGQTVDYGAALFRFER